MKKLVVQTEKQLLARTQQQLIIWFLCAFVLFALLLLGSIYFVLRDSLLQASYQEISREWEQKVPSAIQSVLENKIMDNKDVQIDNNAEDVASWIFSSTGQIVHADYYLSRVPGSVRSLFLQTYATAASNPHVQWKQTSLHGAALLIGSRPLLYEGKRIGTILSGYSLASMTRTMHVLMEVDSELGFASLLFILLMTYILTRHSLLPIRGALQRQRNFVNDASHELRTPLTILRGNLELALMESDPEQLESTIKQSLTDVDYLTHIVSDLSLLARSGAATDIRRHRKVDILHIVNRCIGDLQSLAHSANVTLQLSAAPDPLWVHGDATQLRQLVLILMENAIKYNKAGGIVDTCVKQTSNSLEITITDSGIGIAEEELPHVFDRFYRSESVRQAQSGSGIGLAIAMWIVDGHHGHIEVTSQLGHGSTFTVTLPLTSRTSKDLQR